MVNKKLFFFWNVQNPFATQLSWAEKRKTNFILNGMEKKLSSSSLVLG